MKTLFQRFLSKGILAVSLGASSLFAQNLIDQTYGLGTGSFQIGNYLPNLSGRMHLFPDSTTITGWVVDGPGDGIEWWEDPNLAGSLAVDLTFNQASSIYTYVPTIPGAEYFVHFSMRWPVREGGNDTADVHFGSQQSSHVVSSYGGWHPHGSYFYADSPWTLLRFQAEDDGWAGGPSIDDVSVTLVTIPEPSTVSLLLGSGAVLFAFARRSIFAPS